jgi:hypothetical protein
MSRKKKREERNKQIAKAVHNKVANMMPDFRRIMNNEGNIEIKKRMPKYEKLVARIVDSVENEKKLDEAAYKELIDIHPHLRPIVDEMISQARLFSVYDLEPMVIDFDYSKWLNKIKIKIEA